MKDFTIPRTVVLMSALNNNAVRMNTSDGVYRLDPHDALERMLNGHDTYELTTATVVFTGSIDIDDAEIKARLENRA